MVQRYNYAGNMIDSNIRRITVGVGLEKDQQMNFIIGGQHPIKEGEKVIKKTVSLIQETEKHYLVYLESGKEHQLWKKIPKNEYVSEEYFID